MKTTGACAMKTNAIRILELKEIAHTTATYDYDERNLGAVSVANSSPLPDISVADAPPLA
jgi:hypothetical protein